MIIRENFSDLKIAVSQMDGLVAFARELELQQVTLERGIAEIRAFVERNGGQIKGHQYIANGEAITVINGVMFGYR